MPPKSGSAQKYNGTTEERVARAIAWINEDPDSRSQRRASKLFNIGLKRLQNRMKGIRPRNAAHEGQQLLTKVEEDVLEDFVLGLGDLGFPITRRALCEYISSVIRSRDPGFGICGKGYVDRFLKRHPRIRACLRLSLDRVRAGAANPEVIKDYYEKYEYLASRVAVSDRFNMDEKGCMIGQVQRAQVLVRRRARPIQVQDGNRENVTVVECVCADGTAIRPTYIFQGSYVLAKWKEGDPIKANVVTSEHGWMNSKICLSWLRDVFDAETAEKAAGRPRLLVWDGHVSHMTYEAAMYAKNHNILLLCLPPHSTALLQPLDKVLFGPLARAISDEIELAAVAGQPARKEDFARIYARARSKALTGEKILKSFEATGLVPFNPSRIDLTTKVPPRVNEGGLPLPLESETVTGAWLGGQEDDVSDTELSVASSPSSPSGLTLAQIKDLVHRSTTTEAEEELREALSLTFDRMLASNAREVLTHRWATKINNAARARKDGSQRRIGQGTATILTDEAYIQEVREKAARQVAETQQKAQRKTDRERKRLLKKIQDELKRKKREEERAKRRERLEAQKQEKAEARARKAEERAQKKAEQEKKKADRLQTQKKSQRRKSGK